MHSLILFAIVLLVSSFLGLTQASAVASNTKYTVKTFTQEFCQTSLGTKSVQHVRTKTVKEYKATLILPTFVTPSPVTTTVTPQPATTTTVSTLSSTVTSTDSTVTDVLTTTTTPRTTTTTTETTTSTVTSTSTSTTATTVTTTSSIIVPSVTPLRQQATDLGATSVQRRRFANKRSHPHPHPKVKHYPQSIKCIDTVEVISFYPVEKGQTTTITSNAPQSTATATSTVTTTLTSTVAPPTVTSTTTATAPTSTGTATVTVATFTTTTTSTTTTSTATATATHYPDCDAPKNQVSRINNKPINDLGSTPAGYAGDSVSFVGLYDCCVSCLQTSNCFLYLSNPTGGPVCNNLLSDGASPHRYTLSLGSTSDGNLFVAGNGVNGQLSSI